MNDNTNNAAARNLYRKMRIASGKTAADFETACAVWLEADGVRWLTATPDEWLDAAHAVARRGQVQAAEQMQADAEIETAHEQWLCE